MKAAYTPMKTMTSSVSRSKIMVVQRRSPGSCMSALQFNVMTSLRLTGPSYVMACLFSRDGSISHTVKITLEPVDDVARFLEAVVLAGVNHQLSRHSEAAQGLLHLLGVEERHVEVVLAAEEERRR